MSSIKCWVILSEGHGGIGINEADQSEWKGADSARWGHIGQDRGSACIDKFQAGCGVCGGGDQLGEIEGVSKVKIVTKELWGQQ